MMSRSAQPSHITFCHGFMGPTHPSSSVMYLCNDPEPYQESLHGSGLALICVGKDETELEVPDTATNQLNFDDT